MLCVAGHQMINPSWQRPCGALCYHSLKKQLPTDPRSQEDSCWVMISFTLFAFKPSELPHPALAQLLLLLNGTSHGGRGTMLDRGQRMAPGGRKSAKKAHLQKRGLPRLTSGKAGTAPHPPQTV